MECKSIVVNGETMNLEASTLLDVLAHFDLSPDSVVVEINGKILPRGEQSIAIATGDVIELVRFVGGG